MMRWNTGRQLEQQQCVCVCVCLTFPQATFGLPALLYWSSLAQKTKQKKQELWSDASNGRGLKKQSFKGANTHTSVRWHLDGFAQAWHTRVCSGGVSNPVAMRTREKRTHAPKSHRCSSWSHAHSLFQVTLTHTIAHGIAELRYHLYFSHAHNLRHYILELKIDADSTQSALRKTLPH